LSYEDFEIELREGEFKRAALITTGFPDSLTKKRLDEMLKIFETKFRNVLEDFRGDISIFEETDEIIKKIFQK
ncbi:MAG: hypothetical protein ACTSR3_14255, partial [Candidatus Helarchaeota archaeon]